MSHTKFIILAVLLLIIAVETTYLGLAVLDAIDILDVRMSMACGAMIGDE